MKNRLPDMSLMWVGIILLVVAILGNIHAIYIPSKINTFLCRMCICAAFSYVIIFVYDLFIPKRGEK